MSCPLCNCISAGSESVHGVKLLKCDVCGTLRSVAPIAKDLDLFYRDEYKYGSRPGAHPHTIEADEQTAVLRMREYQRRGWATKGCRLLDVGAGNGAFLKVALANGLDAEGVDPASETLREFAVTDHRMRHGLLEEQAFPSGSFDLITLHDVLEHVQSPVVMLKECARICKPSGAIIVELPDIEAEGGKRHLVPEHLFYPAGTLADWADRFCDFAKVERMSCWTPVPSKRVFVLRPIAKERHAVLLPPGIGDVYWPVVKLRATAKALWGADHVDALIVDDGSNKNRSIEYLQRYPFVTARGYLPKKALDKSWRPVWTEAYLRNGKTRFTNVEGCDLFLAYNGVTRWGRSLEDVDLDAPCEWFPPFHTTVAEMQAMDEYRQRYGKWLLAYFVPWGMYKDWLKDMSVATIAETIEASMDAVGAKYALLPGASWDKTSPLAKELTRRLPGRLVNLSGQTNFDQASAMVRGASGVVGFPCGLSMMGVQLRKPTVLIWNKYFVKRFWWNAVAPASWGTWYAAMDTAGITPAVVGKTLAHLACHTMPSMPTTEMMQQEKALAMEKVMLDVMSDQCFVFAPKAQGSDTFRTPDPRPFQSDNPAPPSTIEAGTSIVFAAVLKTGGWCTIEHANTLFRAIKRNMPTSVTCDFVLLTDAVGSTQASTVPLKHGWRGWWSKAELFRGDWRKGDMRPVVYLDLDTAIVGDLTSVLAPILHAVKAGHFVMQEDFSVLRNGSRKGRGSSAFMAWQGDLTAPYEVACKLTDAYRDEDKHKWWIEQEMIEDACKSVRPFVFAQDLIPKNSLVSYKWQVCKNGTPQEKLDAVTRIVGFHGRPRPWEVTGVSWLERALA